MRGVLLLSVMAAVGMTAGSAHAQSQGVPPSPQGWIGFLPGLESVPYGGPPLVVVQAVAEGSPAARMGLAPGDTLLAVNGVPLTGERLRALQIRLRAGDRLELTLRRGGGHRSVLVEVAPRPARFGPRATPTGPGIEVWPLVPEPGWGASSPVYVLRDELIELLRDRGKLTAAVEALRTASGAFGYRPLAPYIVGHDRVAGARLTQLNPRLAEYFERARGLLVVEVAPGTPAAEARLLPGDVLLRVGATEVKGLEALRRAVATASGDRPLTMTLLRRGNRLEVTLPR